MNAITEISTLGSKVTLQCASLLPNKSRIPILKHVNSPVEHDIRFSTSISTYHVIIHLNSINLILQMLLRYHTTVTIWGE